MRTGNGPEARRSRYTIHRAFSVILNAGTSSHLDDLDILKVNLRELAPLDWQNGCGSDLDPLYARPMSSAQLEDIRKQRDQDWASRKYQRDERQSCLEVNDPWATADWADPKDPAQLSYVGAQLHRRLLTLLFSADCHGSLTVHGGWHLLSPSSLRDQHPRIAGTLGKSFGPYQLQSIMHARDQERYRSHTWCIVADGTQGLHMQPSNDKLLRSEICAALHVAQDRIKRDKTYRFSSYPVVVVSFSMFYVRILQVCVLLSANQPPQLTVRKTPYLHIKDQEDKNMNLILQWYMGSPVHEVNALGHLAEEDEDVVDLQICQQPGPSEAVHAAPVAV